MIYQEDPRQSLVQQHKDVKAQVSVNFLLLPHNLKMIAGVSVMMYTVKEKRREMTKDYKYKSNPIQNENLVY